MLLDKLTKWSVENDIGELPESVVGESMTLPEVPVAKDSVLVCHEAGPDDWAYSDWFKTDEYIERPWDVDIMTSYSVIFYRNPNYFRELKKRYQDLIRELYMEHNHNPDETLDNLFAKWAGKEKDLYATICEKYGVEPTVAFTKTGLPLRLAETKQEIKQEVDRVEPEPSKTLLYRSSCGDLQAPVAKEKKAPKKAAKTTTKKVATPKASVKKVTTKKAPKNTKKVTTKKTVKKVATKKVQKKICVGGKSQRRPKWAEAMGDDWEPCKSEFKFFKKLCI